jgi:hypothetical protein
MTVPKDKNLCILIIGFQNNKYLIIIDLNIFV